MMNYPILRLHQIEMTSRCNLRCRYCPSPKLQRPKMDMDEKTYRLSLAAAKHFVQMGTQYELNLAGIGESTMHPEFVRFVAMAREAVGDRCALVLATNGLLMTREMAREIAPYKPMVWVSMHRPEKAGPAIEALREVGLLSGASADPSLASIDWAGQVEWHVSAGERKCDWVKGGRIFVMADGRVSRCCLDATGEGTFTTIDQLNLEDHSTSPYSLCANCDQDLGIPEFPQRRVIKIGVAA